MWYSAQWRALRTKITEVNLSTFVYKLSCTCIYFNELDSNILPQVNRDFIELNKNAPMLSICTHMHARNFH